MEQTDAVATRDEAEVRLADRFDLVLEELGRAKAYARSTYQTDAFQIAEVLMGTDSGMERLLERAARFDEAGLFHGGPWQDPAKLRAPLVSGSLSASGVYPVVEVLSELRMLALATGRATGGAVTREEALEFLNEAMALNLEYVFPMAGGGTEQDRIEGRGGPHREAAIRLFALIGREIGLSSLQEEVVGEIEQIMAQRPILTGGVRHMIQMAGRIPKDATSPEVASRLRRFTSAIDGPTPMTASQSDPGRYRKALFDASESALAAEAEAFAASMSDTGLVNECHAVLLRFIQRRHPELLAVALGVGDAGRAEIEQQADLAHKLLRVALHPGTCQAVIGYAQVLERGLLSRHETAAGLARLVDLDLRPEVRQRLLARRVKNDGVSPNSMLVAGALAVLGQPLGVGQGHNPTCQAARGISLWAQHAPAFLLQLVISAARDGVVEMHFEGTSLESTGGAAGGPRPLDLDLDPVSIVLVPHLDNLYGQMMAAVAYRTEDGHKWVNRALYGRWVPNGFASVFADVAQTTVAGHEDFVRKFYATHHPEYDDGHRLMYPNPVGLCVTNSHGDYLGPHAVSLMRVDEDPQSAELRAYFFNPNNEGRQDWGREVRPSISGHGERPGESSLPFREFAARIYAFHFNPYEEGDAFAVPADEVASVTEAARETWGRSFTWRD